MNDKNFYIMRQEKQCFLKNKWKFRFLKMQLKKIRFLSWQMSPVSFLKSLKTKLASRWAVVIFVFVIPSEILPVARKDDFN